MKLFYFNNLKNNLYIYCKVALIVAFFLHFLSLNLSSCTCSNPTKPHNDLTESNNAYLIGGQKGHFDLKYQTPDDCQLVINDQNFTATDWKIIPQFKKDGKMYTISSISDNCCQNNKNIKGKLTIHSLINKLGKYSFANTRH